MKLYLILFQLFFLFPSLLSAQAIPVEPHEHNLYQEIFGDGDNEFVCYNRVHRNFYVSIFIAVTGLSVVAVSRYRIKKKAAFSLARKNEEIEEKNKNILDSITYAKRLQNAILPSKERLSASLINHFVFYKPKDIVSGDFYWCSEKKGKTFVAAVDCTGHGVPGAFVSMLGFNGLNHSLSLHDDPASILMELDQYVRKGLQQGASGNNVADGMDISLCSIDFQKKEFTFAGAVNEGIFISGGTLNLLPSSRSSIGGDGEFKSFTSTKYSFSEGDSLFLFTDGFSDQFGGAKGKKFMFKNLRNLFLEISDRPADDQLRSLDKAISEWKGAHEQVDDILVLGVKF